MPQSLSSLLVHLVFSTKGRHPWISPELEAELHPYLATVMQACESPALVINGTQDHVHILFVLARTQRLCDVVEEVKKRSSRWAKTKGTAYRGFQWQAGYGAFSLGQSMVATVKKYIANQKQHHGRRSFQDEFRDILARYQIDYDERYVWD